MGHSSEQEKLIWTKNNSYQNLSHSTTNKGQSTDTITYQSSKMADEIYLS